MSANIAKTLYTYSLLSKQPGVLALTSSDAMNAPVVACLSSGGMHFLAAFAKRGAAALVMERGEVAYTLAVRHSTL
jgi:hypothetical protein